MASCAVASRGATAPVAGRLRLRPLEACTGIPWGLDSLAPELPRGGASPREALEAQILAALERPPCLVAFSGGRDSSAILALAIALASREGLPQPIAVTNRFASVPQSLEDDWQRLVIDHLGIKSEDWLRLDWQDELDLIGPYARRLLERSGLVFPFNAHFLEPLAEQASGGSLLTGIGGDELYGTPWRPAAIDVLYRRRFPARGHRRLLIDFAPRRLRAWADSRRHWLQGVEWLRPEARHEIVRQMSLADASAPIRWDRSMQFFWRTRYVQCLLATLSDIGLAHDTRITPPFMSPSVLAAFASRYGPRGPGPRETGLREITGQLLPQRLTERRAKATFDPVFWGAHTHAFVRSWTGEGLDDQLIDREALITTWRSGRPPVTTFSLLQQAWLATRRFTPRCGAAR